MKGVLGMGECKLCEEGGKGVGGCGLMEGVGEG